ncbi:MAG: hypothetical protein RLZZ414_1513 [Bacteroidota bacterium]|jgi:uncharacterized membrane protein YheB (UPF0754 family)
MLVYLLPLIAAFTGWLTNYVAVKMLFHPKKPIQILGIKIQGVFPKRQMVLAEKLGHIVAQELFSVDDILNSLKSEKNSQIALQLVENKIDDFIALKLPQSMPMLAMFLNEDLKNKIKSVLLSELGTILPDLLAQLGNNIKDNINIQQIVYKKVADFSSDKFEEILFSIMQKEFRLIEILGGILGFIIGIIQLLLVKFA